MALIDRVKFGGPPNTLVWRWPGDSLVLGTQLIVNESQEALFFKGGQALDLFGPGTHTLATANIPLLQKLVNLPFGGKTPFSAEIYFVSRAVVPGQGWGTKTPVMLEDSKYGVTIPLRGYGEYSVRVDNAREFVTEIVGTSAGTRADAAASSIVETLILSSIQQAFGEFLVHKGVSALKLPAYAGELTDLAFQRLSDRYRTFGLELINFTIESINFDPNDESVKKLRASLDEASRLNVVGDAFRQNQDFYRAERQFDVMQSAAEGEGAAGALMGATMGVGMGFGMAGRTGDVARDAMAPPARSEAAPVAGPRCSECGEAHPPGAKFCNACGQGLVAPARPCAGCGAENNPAAKFCSECGAGLGRKSCSECGTELEAGARFCSECGTRT